MITEKTLLALVEQNKNNMAFLDGVFSTLDALTMVGDFSEVKDRIFDIVYWHAQNGFDNEYR